MAHTCHARGCSVVVPPRLFMCREHWFALPKPLRDAIWREYVPGQEVGKTPSTGYLEVADEAIRYLADRGRP